MQRFFSHTKAFLLCLSAACSLQANAQYLEHLYDYIENTAVFEEGQEEGHAYYLAPDHLSLNGPWRFFFANTPEEVPTQFFAPNFKDVKWASIQVPLNWEMAGYGDPQFRNVPAPFKANPPYVPREYNPTGRQPRHRPVHHLHRRCRDGQCRHLQPMPDSHGAAKP